MENNGNKHKLKNEGFTNDFKIKEEQSCDPLPKQINPTPGEKSAVKHCEKGTKNKVKENDIDRKEVKYSGFESGSESDDDILQKKHPNRRLQSERAASDLTREHPNRLKVEVPESFVKRKHPNRLQVEMPESIVKREHPNRLQDEVPESAVKREHPKRFRTERKVTVLKKERPNRLQTGRTQVSVSHSGNGELSKLRTSPQRRQKRKVYELSHGCEDNRLGEPGQSCSLPQAKRRKWSSDETTAIPSIPERWNTEHNKADIGKCRKMKSVVNYHELLNRYITCDSVRKLKQECWETRFLEKLNDQSNINFLMEFYIPPAQVELFHMDLTDEFSCIECLRKVCENRNWPLPVYKPIAQTDTTTGFLYSCELKSEKFTPSKSASNHLLAQELAAQTCLDQLGLSRRRASTPVEAKYSIDTNQCEQWLLNLIEEFDEYKN